MDEYAVRQFKTMLERLDSVTNSFMEGLPGNEKVTAETMQAFYQQELETFLEFFEQGQGTA